MLADTCLLPVPKPPSFAQAFAAGAVARNFTNASIAGVSRKVTKRSPPISTAVELAPGLIDGNGAVLNPLPAFDLVEDVITPPTKSPSSTIAAFGGDPTAFVTESWKLYVSAPDVPPARFDELPITCAIVFSAVVTDESVHLILCSLRALYFAGPNVRR